MALLESISDLQAKLMSVQTENYEILRLNEELTKKIIEQENWKEERSRYELKKLDSACFVYCLKSSAESIEPAHWICANCYEQSKKSILQRNGTRPQYWCPACKNLVVSSEFPE